MSLALGTPYCFAPAWGPAANGLSSAGMSYLQNQIRHKKPSYERENRFSVQCLS